jgi:putative selenate reductase molybdopterin-binding subunit
MEVHVNVNGVPLTWVVEPVETLLHVLRREGFYGVKHGCEDGMCGVCAVILDGKLVNSCIMLAAQADGKRITTIEALGSRERLDPLQAAFVEAGAIQCGYCTPARILAAKALLEENAHPSEEEVRDALGGVLCRCTGYVKPVEAVMRVVNGEARHVPPV